VDVPLTADLIEAAYRQGIFPMDDDGIIRWYSPDPRAVFELDRFHVPRSAARMIRKKAFEITTDRNFEDTMRGCAGRAETWISEALIAAYTEMHRRGKAHSVEARREGRLVGGVYGVSLGGAFMGESMFSRESGASTACLVFLVRHLRERGYRLFDIQFLTTHLKRFGAVEIPRRTYLRRLAEALALDRRWSG
jgi:leucyl/phenylalanyl-tRNA--protein transferase